MKRVTILGKGSAYMSGEYAIKGLYEIIELIHFRETPGVNFDIVPKSILEEVKGVDRVIHSSYAISPGPVGEIKRPWYMHTCQSDHLIVLHGKRYVDLYSEEHGQIEHFVVSPDKIYKNGELLCDVPAVLSWPPYVFHRIESKKEGSASMNFAFRFEGYDVKTNFSIYDLDIQNKTYREIRKGDADQFVK